MRTGMRWTTLVKFPVALSGGSRAKVAPLAGERRATRPCRTTLGNVPTVTSIAPTRVTSVGSPCSSPPRKRPAAAQRQSDWCRR